RRRHRPGAVEGAGRRRDEAVDPREAAEAALLSVRPATEEAARLEEEARERPRLDAVRVEERERAEARPHTDAPAPAEFVERRRQRARIGLGGGELLHP